MEEADLITSASTISGLLKLAGGVAGLLSAYAEAHTCLWRQPSAASCKTVLAEGDR